MPRTTTAVGLTLLAVTTWELRVTRGPAPWMSLCSCRTNSGCVVPNVIHRLTFLLQAVLTHRFLKWGLIIRFSNLIDGVASIIAWMLILQQLQKLKCGRRWIERTPTNSLDTVVECFTAALKRQRLYETLFLSKNKLKSFRDTLLWYFVQLWVP